MAKSDYIWRAKNIIAKNKQSTADEVVIANLLYSDESWAISKRNEQRLRASELKKYKMMLGNHGKKKNKRVGQKNDSEIGGYEPEGLAVWQTWLGRESHVFS